MTIDHKPTSGTPAVSPRRVTRRPAASPPLPDVPACWTWPPPPLPQPCDIWRVRTWQDGRCAVCGQHATLDEDHDHATGDTRGYLCRRCNTCEAFDPPHPVYVLYRQRHPTVIFGILHRKGRAWHPRVKAANEAWKRALAHIACLASEDWAAARRDWLDNLCPSGVALPACYQLPERTPLMDAAERVGWTRQEWEDIQARRYVAMRDRWQPRNTEADPTPLSTGDSR